MAKVTEITVRTRGVVMDKEARDVANAFAQAAKMEGKFTQAFDNYEDLPDRVLVTTRKYVRISDQEIQMKYLYVNEHPDVVVIVEPTIIKGINILRGMPEGGLLVINTNRPRTTCSSSFPMWICWGLWQPSMRTGSPGSGPSTSPDRKGAWIPPVWGQGLPLPSWGAMAKVTGMVKKENLAKVVSDVAAMERGYQEAKIQKFRKARSVYFWGS